MTAEIITIGDELLIGQVVDTNSAWIGKHFHRMGIPVRQVTSISDEPDHIVSALTKALAHSNLILITGGLGPTKDDLTKHTLAKFFNMPLEMNETVLQRITDYFSQRGREMAAVNRDQALMPKGAKVLDNLHGTASGMWFEHEGKVVISVPGVPFEMKHILETGAFPAIQEYFKLPFCDYRTVLTQGIGESNLMEIIADWEDALVQQGLKLAYLPSSSRVRLRISGKDDHSMEALTNKLEASVSSLKRIIPEFIFGYEEESLEQKVGELAIQGGFTIGTAESCTGGYISHLLTSVPGSSAYFEGSVVSYSNQVKMEVLGVEKVALDSFGAVSEEVVSQMAKGAKKQLNVDFAIATSGIAGPDGGTKEKPVGTIWLAVATPNGLITKKLQLGNHRRNNIEATAQYALRMLQKEIEKTID